MALQTPPGVAVAESKIMVNTQPVGVEMWRLSAQKKILNEAG